jgi:hypothetical protein
LIAIMLGHDDTASLRQPHRQSCHGSLGTAQPLARCWSRSALYGPGQAASTKRIVCIPAPKPNQTTPCEAPRV